MARGWESKSVEEQQSQAAARETPRNRPVTPEEAAKQRKRQGLILSRARVVDQLSLAQNPSHRQMLERALAELDQQLAQLL